jgi:hypothetical protein
MQYVLLLLLCLSLLGGVGIGADCIVVGVGVDM